MAVQAACIFTVRNLFRREVLTAVTADAVVT